MDAYRHGGLELSPPRVGLSSERGAQLMRAVARHTARRTPAASSSVWQHTREDLVQLRETACAQLPPQLPYKEWLHVLLLAGAAAAATAAAATAAAAAAALSDGMREAQRLQQLRKCQGAGGAAAAAQHRRGGGGRGAARDLGRRRAGAALGAGRGGAARQGPLDGGAAHAPAQGHGGRCARPAASGADAALPQREVVAADAGAGVAYVKHPTAPLLGMLVHVAPMVMAAQNWVMSNVSSSSSTLAQPSSHTLHNKVMTKVPAYDVVAACAAAPMKALIVSAALELSAK